MQILIQLQAYSTQAEQLKHWCLYEWGESLVQSSALAKIIVNIALPEIQLLPYGQTESLQGDAIDVVIQLWLHTEREIKSVLQKVQLDFAGRVAQMHIYQVTDTEVLNRHQLPQGTVKVPGIKIMRGLFLYDDLLDTAAKRMWAHHSDLAARVHIGLVRYARHWVDQVITAGSPAIRGLSDLHFPDLDSLQNRYFDSQRGREEISHDIGHFIQDGTVRFFAEEYLLKR